MSEPKRIRRLADDELSTTSSTSEIDLSDDDEIQYSPPAQVLSAQSSPFRLSSQASDMNTNHSCEAFAISQSRTHSDVNMEDDDSVDHSLFPGSTRECGNPNDLTPTDENPCETNIADTTILDDISDYSEPGSESEEVVEAESEQSETDVSDLSMSEDEEIDLNVIGDPPVYKGARITVSESMTAILSYIIRHEPSGKEILDLLNLINLHCKEEENRMITTLYFFKKYFSLLGCQVVYHYYCSACYAKLQKKSDICPNLKEHPESSEVSIFVELPLIPQIQSLFTQEEFYTNFASQKVRAQSTNKSTLEDTYDGQLYQELVQSGFMSVKNPCNFSLSLNSDGVPVFHSTKKSLWPIFLNVLELPPHLRFKQEFTLIAGLWFGGKPSANVMLSPLLPKFRTMSNGFVVKPFGVSKDVKARGIVLSATTDLPAKILLLGMASYSGKFGCQVCKIEGGSVKITKKNKKEVKTTSVWVYKYSRDLDLRNKSETERYGKDAQAALVATGNDTNIYGVKFPSAILKIMYDAIRGFAIDDLHTLYLGVTKAKINLWFDSTNSSQPFSIRKHLSVVDKRLKEVKLPNFLERGVVSIEDLSNWKGKDFLAWLHYLSVPILDGILPDKYMQHHIDLVSCLQLLQRSPIDRNALRDCDKTLDTYVKNFEVLYGSRHMSMVVHLLQHLVYVVTNLGPLQYLSCFPYESLNGDILKMIHGTRYIETQLASCSYLIRQLPHRLKDLPPNSSVKDFCDNTLHPSKRLKINEKICSDIFSVGTYSSRLLPENFVTALKRNIQVNNKTVLQSFLRLKKGKLLFFSRSYSRSTKTNSYTCCFSDNSLTKYGAIDVFIKVSSETGAQYFAIVEIGNTQPYIVSHIKEFSLTNNYLAIPVQDLQKMLIFITVENRSFVCEPLDHSLKS
ncbi:hypothetical protein FOCC_FOCC012689 [Frankliniella occidentalis]|nr:hypothetical protein FOCC_FOCC012689 [Frankliniella occidentalis]